MRMLSGDANPFSKRLSSSGNTWYSKKSSPFLSAPHLRNPPMALLEEEYSESNVSALSYDSIDNSSYINSKCRLNYTKTYGMNVTRKNLDYSSQARLSQKGQMFSRSIDRTLNTSRHDDRHGILNEAVPEFLVARANLKKSNQRFNPLIELNASQYKYARVSNPSHTVCKIPTEVESRDDNENLCSHKKPDDRDSDMDSLYATDLSTKEDLTSELSTLTPQNIPTKFESVHHPQGLDKNGSRGSSISASISNIERLDSTKSILNTMLLSRRSPEYSATGDVLQSSGDTVTLKDKYTNADSITSNSSSDVKSVLNTMLLSRSNLPNDQSIFRKELKELTTEIPKSHTADLSNLDQKNISSVEATKSLPDKYLKMIKMGVPISAVKNHMVRDGINTPSSFFNGSDFNPPTVPKEKDPFRRTRLHWMPLEKFSSESVWHQIKNDPDLHNIPIDEEEFQSLFQMKVQSPRTIFTRVKDNLNETVVKVIDAKRANNGGIILAGLRMSFDEIVKAVNSMDESFFTVQQIKGLLEYIPTPKERHDLTRFISEGGDGSLMSLSECERFMVSLLPIDKVQEKMQIIHFKLHFPSAIKDFEMILETLSKACDEVLLSTKLRKMLGAILKIGNHLNHAGQIPRSSDTVAFALESLKTLNQVKAWDKKTTLLSYISSIIQRWNESILSVKDDIPNVIKVSSLNGNDYEESLKGLSEQLNRIQRTVEAINSDDNDVFLSEATSTLNRLKHSNIQLRENFEKVLDYLAENRNVKPMELFCSLSSFCNDLENVRLLLSQKDSIGKNRINRRLC